MALEAEIDTTQDGVVKVGDARKVDIAPVLEARQGEEDSAVDEILRLIEDPESSLADITRLIAIEIAKAMKKMTTKHLLEQGTTPQRDLVEQVKAWRELQKTLHESDTLAKKDGFNMEGPKFAYFFKEMISVFQQTLRDSGVDPSLQQNIMLQFGDAIKSRDEQIRRELSKIESGR